MVGLTMFGRSGVTGAEVRYRKKGVAGEAPLGSLEFFLIETLSLLLSRGGQLFSGRVYHILINE